MLSCFLLGNASGIDIACIGLQKVNKNICGQLELLTSLYILPHLFALRPKSTTMVMAGRSVHLTTLFLCKLEQDVNQYFVYILSLVTDNNPS